MIFRKGLVTFYFAIVMGTSAHAQYVQTNPTANQTITQGPYTTLWGSTTTGVANMNTFYDHGTGGQPGEYQQHGHVVEIQTDPGNFLDPFAIYNQTTPNTGQTNGNYYFEIHNLADDTLNSPMSVGNHLMGLQHGCNYIGRWGQVSCTSADIINFSNGIGLDNGPNRTSASGWGGSKVFNINHIVTARGIDQSYSEIFVKAAAGDTADRYPYVFAYGGSVAPADESITGEHMQLDQLGWLSGNLSSGYTPGSTYVVAGTSFTCHSPYNDFFCPQSNYFPDGGLLMDAQNAGITATVTKCYSPNAAITNSGCLDSSVKPVGGLAFVLSNVSGGSITPSTAFGNLISSSCTNNQSGVRQNYDANYNLTQVTACPVVLGAGSGLFTIAPITAWSITSNVATFTVSGNLPAVGQSLNLSGFGTSTFWNNFSVQVTSISGSTFMANLPSGFHGNASATETGAASQNIGLSSSQAEETYLATVSSGGVVSVTVTAGGTGYTSAPTVSFTGGDGSGLTATATVSGGAVTGVTVTNPGTGYTIAPAVAFSGGAGSGAVATSNMDTGNASVNAAKVTAGGSGYTSAPTVTISGGGGSGATATATVSGGAVTAITINNPGTGYTSVPTVSFGGPGTGAAATIALVQDIGFYTRYAYNNGYAAQVFQGGPMGMSFVYTATASSWPIAYWVLGATDATTMWVTNCRLGNCSGDYGVGNLGFKNNNQFNSNLLSNVGSITRTSNVVTFTAAGSAICAAMHTFYIGSQITLSGWTPSDLNNAFTVTGNNQDCTNFVMTWAQTGANETSSVTGGIGYGPLNITLYPSAWLSGSLAGYADSHLGPNHVPFASGDYVFSAPAAEYNSVGKAVRMAQMTQMENSDGMLVEDVGPTPMGSMFYGYQSNSVPLSANGTNFIGGNGNFQSVISMARRPVQNGCVLCIGSANPMPGTSNTPYYIFTESTPGAQNGILYSPATQAYTMWGPVTTQGAIQAGGTGGGQAGNITSIDGAFFAHPSGTGGGGNYESPGLTLANSFSDSGSLVLGAPYPNGGVQRGKMWFATTNNPYAASFDKDGNFQIHYAFASWGTGDFPHPFCVGTACALWSDDSGNLNAATIHSEGTAAGNLVCTANGTNCPGPAGEETPSITFGAVTLTNTYAQHTITLNANVTITWANPSATQGECITFKHDATTTAYTVTWPGAVHGGFQPGTTASAYNTQCFQYLPSLSVRVATSQGEINQ